MFSKQIIQEFYKENVKFKRDIIYNYLDKIIDINQSLDVYHGMLLSISLFLILKDSLSGQMIFSGMYSVWMRNAALVIFDRILTIQSAAEEENIFSAIEDLDEIV